MQKPPKTAKNSCIAEAPGSRHLMASAAVSINDCFLHGKMRLQKCLRHSDLRCPFSQGFFDTASPRPFARPKVGLFVPHSMNFPDFTWSLNFDGLRCTRTDLSRDPGEGLPISACPGGHCVPSGGLAKVPCRRRLPIAPSWVAGGRIAPVAPSLPPARGEAIARPANVPAGRPRPP